MTPDKPTLTDACRHLGRQVFVRLTNSRNGASTDFLEVLCHAREVKRGYGAVRVRVEPVAGRGSLWVDASRVQDTGRGDA